MTNVTSLERGGRQPAISAEERARFEILFDEFFETRMQQHQARHTPSMAIIATKGTLDWAYPPFILASTGAALGWDVSVFFTFYGLRLLQKRLALEVSPLGNPAMPMKMPYGPDWFRRIDWALPNAVPSVVPGFEKAATQFMKKTFRDKGIASIEELREAAIDVGVKLVACQMTVDAFGFERDEFIAEIDGWVGAAAFLPRAQKADISLFI